MATTPLHYRQVLLITFSLAFTLSSNLVETRTFARTNSRSFRFPSSAEESSLLFLAAKEVVRESNNLGYTDASNQGRNAVAVITLDSNPIKAAVVPESPGRPEEENKSKNRSTSFDDQETEGGIGISVESNEEIEVAKDEDERKDDNSHEDEALRQALCSSSTTTNSSSVPTTTNAKLRYDLRAGKCAEVGKREHCGRNMIFVAEIDSSAYGYCECDFENRVLRQEVKQAALFTQTPLVYHPESQACYRLYEQAYCSDGEWLVLSREKKGPACEPKRCPEKESQNNIVIRTPSNRRRASKLLTPSFWTEGSTATVSESEPSEKNERLKNTTHAIGNANDNAESIWVPLNGSGPCVKLFAKNLEHCEADESVMFRVGDIVPKCGIIGRGIEGRAIIRNACPPGCYYSIIGRCQPDWDF